MLGLVPRKGATQKLKRNGLVSLFLFFEVPLHGFYTPVIDCVSSGLLLLPTSFSIFVLHTVRSLGTDIMSSHIEGT